MQEYACERFKVCPKKMAREVFVGAYHLLSSLFSISSLCLLRACWLQPRPKPFTNKTRQPRKVFRLLNITMAFTAAAGLFAPIKDADDPEANNLSI